MCGTASGWAKLALLSIFIGFALHVSGWATMHWMVYETSGSVLEINVGLWRQRTCVNTNCDTGSVDGQYEIDMFHAVRAMETITFCLATFACILMTMYVFSEMSRRQSVAITLMVICISAATVSVIGMIVWLVYVPDPFIVSYSMGLTVLAYILIYISGILLIPDIFGPDDPYYRSRNISTPQSPQQRQTIVTPMSYRERGIYNW